ncbi:YybH family protein [Flagellimonas aequoris]|uniref:DUF4440 domain-containing protein n=1 Tax=Flagellimonas aequoris TaxID=2306997 RepID=A0A418NA23_9FLAO|nr:DUF4440 domain-containing protein [Allomuricauda aequoris]RIV72073.1 DUF4440 domain-containing protein [Allomuricauda aequoris]TXK03843.1 DUF4440 domain-containing protein [Allomuricauda aequoris]
MKNLFLLVFLFPIVLCAQYQYEPSQEHPYGLPNPAAPSELLDFAPLIGECQCLSQVRKPDQSWAEPVKMIWRFKYIMNGMAIQDETLKEDGTYSGSIRQFSQDSTRWYVHYYSYPSVATSLPVWEGNKKEDDKIILYREQKAPNGTEGFFRITFSEMDGDGFKWIGEWVDKSESFVYPTWKIDCSNSKFENSFDKEKRKIIAATKVFSKAYMNGDFETIANSYTKDAKIFPNNTDIISGREAIKERWMLGAGTKILHHELLPLEIKFFGNYAHDYGYYQGKSENKDGSIANWRGKYVVIWKKEDGEWKMYLDIWNRIQDQTRP